MRPCTFLSLVMSADMTLSAVSWVAERLAIDASEGPVLQSLWSGYGEVRRIKLSPSRPYDPKSAVLKSVRPPAHASHPRGWAGDNSHRRKLRSYDIELAFWQRYASRYDAACRVPKCHGARETKAGFDFLLEDLDASGYSARRHSLDARTVEPCLRWLAAFHATNFGVAPDGLWPVGTYWHLDTRPDELVEMNDANLRDAASELDARLRACPHQTIVHGDAKVANFCFSPDGSKVAAVDFQYCGGGVGVKDVAYLLASCFDEEDCDEHAEAALDTYFSSLSRELRHRRPDVDTKQVENAWRALYPAAWADYLRFLNGWAPGHHRVHGYSRRMVTAALRQDASG